MKTTLYSILLLLLFVIVSCKDESKQSSYKPEISKETIVDTTAISIPLCYLYAVNKDSIKLNVLQTREKIQGEMNYNFHQIDGSFGTFTGIMKGDTIIGVYNFEAEGNQSMRELVFLKTGNSLIQGKGETEIVENTELFKKDTPFSFTNGRRLKSVECKPKQPL